MKLLYWIGNKWNIDMESDNLTELQSRRREISGSDTLVEVDGQTPSKEQYDKYIENVIPTVIEV